MPSLAPHVWQAMISAGGGLLIALMILIGLYRLADKHGSQFIQAQQQQAIALGSQADSMKEMQAAIKEFIGRDNSEHREMLILQKLMIEKINGLEDSLNGYEKGKV